MRTLLKFLSHIGKVGNAEKGKRVFYSIIHIIGIALGIAAFFGGIWMVKNNASFMDANVGAWVLACIGTVILFAFSLLMFIEGFIAQFVLMICAFIGIRNPEERGYCVITAVVCVISLAAAVVAAVLIIMKLI